MDSRRWALGIALAALSGGAFGCGGSASSLVGADGGRNADATAPNNTQFAGDSGAGVAPGAGSLTPAVFGGGSGGTASCLGLGGGCASGGDCCSDDCEKGVCSYPACTSDHGACAANGDCCSQKCSGGTCAPAQHDVQDARQPVRLRRRVLLGPLLERHLPGLVVLRPGRRRVLGRARTAAPEPARSPRARPSGRAGRPRRADRPTAASSTVSSAAGARPTAASS